MTFSEILKYIRKQQNYTQEQFARELNVSFSTINRWENGHMVILTVLWRVEYLLLLFAFVMVKSCIMMNGITLVSVRMFDPKSW